MLSEIFLILGQLLPNEQPFIETSLQGPSFGSTVGCFKGSSEMRFVYRLEKIPEIFFWDCTVTQIAADLGLSPRLIAKSDADQCMVLEYIEQEPWPAYDINPQPYHECMRLLRAFHRSAPAMIASQLEKCPHSKYFPFRDIEDIAKRFQKGDIPVPRHFFKISDLVQLIFEKLLPHLESGQAMCHNDFHIYNCLLSKERVYIIDWATTAPFSDPLHDVASFACILKPEQREELLQCYLGKETVSVQELAHYRLMEFVSLARIAAMCFYDQSRMPLPSSDEKEAIVQEMQNLLDSNALCGTSFLSHLYALDPEQLRMRALCALQECLNGSDTVRELLKQF